MKEKMQYSNFKKTPISSSGEKEYIFKLVSSELRLLKNINSTLSYMLSLGFIIAGILFVMFVFILYVYFH